MQSNGPGGPSYTSNFLLIVNWRVTSLILMVSSTVGSTRNGSEVDFAAGSPCEHTGLLMQCLLQHDQPVGSLLMCGTDIIG